MSTSPQARDLRTLALTNAVASAGGVSRATALHAAGHSPYVVADAVARGILMRVRRAWVALPDADPDLVSAARHGVVLSCVTQARRRGLWVLGSEGPHVAASPRARGGKPPGVRVHWSEPLVPRHPDALEDPIENVLALVAACQPLESALTVWESAVHIGLVDRMQLERLPLGGRAREILSAMSAFTESGLETLFVVRLRWLRVRILPQAWILGHRVDFLIGERLVVQIDGGHHVGAQRTRDIAHDAALLVAGFHVIRLSYAQIVDDWPGVQDLIARAVAQGLHRAA